MITLTQPSDISVYLKEEKKYVVIDVLWHHRYKKLKKIK